VPTRVSIPVTFQQFVFGDHHKIKIFYLKIASWLMFQSKTEASNINSKK